MNEDILAQLGSQGDKPTDVPEEKKEDIKYEDKKKSEGKHINDEVLQSLINNGDNTKGMFTPKEKEDKDDKAHEEVDEEAKFKVKSDAKPSKKYEKVFQEDMQKNPEKYYVNTPRGKMTLKEAEAKGYDPLTHRFNRKEQKQKEIDQILSTVNDKDKAGIKALLDPAQAGLAQADAEKMGLESNSPLVKPAEGGNPQESLGAATPPAAQATPEGADQGNPLAALLGGGM